MSDNVRGFQSTDEMFAFMQEQERQANANVSPDQAQIGYGAYWMRVDQEVTIFGYVPTEAEIRVSEGGDEVDQEELAYTLEMLRDAHQRGYRYGKCYSAWEPEGEWGSTHISVMIEIQEWQFKRAQKQGWDYKRLMNREDGRWMIGHMLRAGAIQPEQVGLKPWPNGKNPFLK